MVWRAYYVASTNFTLSYHDGHNMEWAILGSNLLFIGLAPQDDACSTHQQGVSSEVPGHHDSASHASLDLGKPCCMEGFQSHSWFADRD